MTRRLWLALVESRLGCLGMVFFLGIFLLLLPFSLALDLLLGARERARVDRALRQPSTRCPAGHEVGLHGGWTCGVCGATYEGSGLFCDFCERVPATVRCSCGRSVRSPLWRPE